MNIMDLNDVKTHPYPNCDGSMDRNRILPFSMDGINYHFAYEMPTGVNGPENSFLHRKLIQRVRHMQAYD